MNDLIKNEQLIEISADCKPTRQDIDNLQKALSTLPQCDSMVTNHYFANGMYCRELHRKAGTLIVGKVHKHEHFFMVTKGQINVWTEEGMVEMKAPYVLVTKPGTKRVTLAMEDSTGMTVHRTDNTNLDDIEKEILEEDGAALFDSSNAIKELLLKKEG